MNQEFLKNQNPVFKISFFEKVKMVIVELLIMWILSIPFALAFGLFFRE